jgi:hypothetical protein
LLGAQSVVAVVESSCLDDNQKYNLVGCAWFDRTEFVTWLPCIGSVEWRYNSKQNRNTVIKMERMSVDLSMSDRGRVGFISQRNLVLSRWSTSPSSPEM